LRETIQLLKQEVSVLKSNQFSRPEQPRDVIISKSTGSDNIKMADFNALYDEREKIKQKLFKSKKDED